MIWKQNRNCNHTSYKFEADFMSDPIWCNDCGVNLEIDNFPISDKLQEELLEWISEYGNWIELETDLLKENGVKLEEWHNEKGLRLFQELKKQLRGKYPIVFVPSSSAQQYNELENG
ncbi:hypothetical protein [Bacillus sp. D386]|uniref:hypothetical protein n=1 Tax=Bacillus sp. D386 TaxID=2587155 RepID=UPI00111FDAF9|nr:hypothetical protein [Bacillus sp. D386]